MRLTEADNGLCWHKDKQWEQPAPGRDTTRIFINPPYDQSTLDIVEVGCSQHVGEILLLAPSKTDQGWFQRAIRRSDAVCFIRGRVKFGDKGVGAAFSSCLFYWGDEATKFARVFGSLGAVLNLGGDK